MKLGYFVIVFWSTYDSISNFFIYWVIRDS